MWSSVETLTSLKEWTDVLGFNPWLASGITEPYGTILPSIGACERGMIQRSSTGGGEYLSRDEIAYALGQAEDILAEKLHTFVAPREWYDTLAEDVYPRNYDTTHLRSIFTAMGEYKPFRVKWGNLVDVGRYTTTLVEEAVAITLSDPYGDGIDTRFSVDVTVPSGTVAGEILVYHNERYDLPLDQCRIKGLEITVSDTTATIKGWAYQLVDLQYYLRAKQPTLNATDSIYDLAIDVYRQTVDEEQSGYLIWESDCDTPPCTQVLGTSCFRIADRRHGWVRPVPATYDSVDAEFDLATINSAPDRVRCNYISGVPRDNNGLVAMPWRRAVVYLATSMLANKSCGCSRADQILAYYRNDYTEQENGIGNSPEMIRATSSTFGTTGRGAVRAYAIMIANQSSRVFRSANG